MRPLVQVQVGPPTNSLRTGGFVLLPGKLDHAGVPSRSHCVRIGGVPGDGDAAGGCPIESIEEVSVRVQCEITAAMRDDPPTNDPHSDMPLLGG